MTNILRASVTRAPSTATVAVVAAEIERALTQLALDWQATPTASSDTAVLVDAAQILAQIEGALLIINEHGLAVLAQLVRDQLLGSNRAEVPAVSLGGALVQQFHAFIQRALNQCLRGKKLTVGELLQGWQRLLGVGLPTTLHPSVLIPIELDQQAVARSPLPQTTQPIPAAPTDPDHLLLNLLRAQDDAGQRAAAESIGVLFEHASRLTQQVEARWYWQALHAYFVEYGLSGGDAARLKKIASAAVRLLRHQHAANLEPIAAVTREALFELSQQALHSAAGQAVVDVFQLQSLDQWASSPLPESAREDAVAALARASDAFVMTIEADATLLLDPASWSSLADRIAPAHKLADIVVVLRKIAAELNARSIDSNAQQLLAAGLCCLRECISPETLFTVVQLIHQQLDHGADSDALDRCGCLWRAHRTQDLIHALAAAIQADISHVAHLLDGEPALDAGAIVKTAMITLDRIVGALALLGLSQQATEVTLLADTLRTHDSNAFSDWSCEAFARQWAILQADLAQLPWHTEFSAPSSANPARPDEHLDTIFIEEASSLIQTMRECARNANVAGLVQAAHTLGGCSATVGLSSLSELALALEAAQVQQAANAGSVPAGLLEESIAYATALLEGFAKRGVNDTERTEGTQQDLVQRLHACAGAAAAVAETVTTPSLLVEVGWSAPQIDACATPGLVALDTQAPLPLISSTLSDAVAFDRLIEPDESNPHHRNDESDEPDEPSEQNTNDSNESHKTRDLPDSNDQRDPTDRSDRLGPLTQSDPNQELYEIFKLEAADWLPQLEQALIEWQRYPEEPAHPDQLLRVLHTLKGSARMAGDDALGAAFHQAETDISVLRRQPPSHITQRIPQLRQLVDSWVYQLTQSSQVSERLQPTGGSPTGCEIEPPASSGTVGQSNDVPAVNSTSAAAVDSGVVPIPAAPAKPAPMLRVRADRLAQVADTSAEIWSSNARLREGLQSQRRSLLDMADDLNRLRSQLRELEIEAESRVLARAHQGTATEFDPLEFDRYTRLHELTRMMAESITDVVGVQRGLAVQLEQLSTATAEQLRDLRQQQAELHALRSQPLHTVEARLRHELQRAAREVGCAAELVLQQGTVEIERRLLDRLLGPLEHLLRNAVVHGLESAEQRQAAGKPALGRVTISASLTGNELQLLVEDDGRGLNLARIRQRALEVGLIAAAAQLDPRELRELIFAPGLSTASEVTALSGRGIGMDAVRAEIRAMGGQITVDSEPGQGCRFTLRVPVGLASLQVVLVRAGQWRVGLPAALMQQVMQVDSGTLNTDDAQLQIEWQGRRIPVLPLAQGLGAASLSRSSTPGQRVPVAVLSDAEKIMALQLDLIEGQRELIVKPPGAQLAAVPGLVGVSVLPDGAIAMIFHPFRLPATLPLVPSTVLTPQQTLVLVVDDSLTVRRASQRFLERHGCAVGLARDGVEALEFLQNASPALILLDIEMPRMDGFELLATLREDARWRAIPVVMITSRIADRHRERAMQLGANAYLGKPYREDDVLQLLSSVIPGTQWVSEDRIASR